MFNREIALGDRLGKIASNLISTVVLTRESNTDDNCGEGGEGRDEGEDPHSVSSRRKESERNKNWEEKYKEKRDKRRGSLVRESERNRRRFIVSVLDFDPGLYQKRIDRERTYLLTFSDIS